MSLTQLNSLLLLAIKGFAFGSGAALGFYIILITLSYWI